MDINIGLLMVFSCGIVMVSFVISFHHISKIEKGVYLIFKGIPNHFQKFIRVKLLHCNVILFHNSLSITQDVIQECLS